MKETTAFWNPIATCLTSLWQEGYYGVDSMMAVQFGLLKSRTLLMETRAHCSIPMLICTAAWCSSHLFDCDYLQHEHVQFMATWKAKRVRDWGFANWAVKSRVTKRRNFYVLQLTLQMWLRFKKRPVQQAITTRKQRQKTEVKAELIDIIYVSPCIVGVQG